MCTWAVPLLQFNATVERVVYRVVYTGCVQGCVQGVYLVIYVFTPLLLSFTPLLLLFYAFSLLLRMFSSLPRVLIFYRVRHQSSCPCGISLYARAARHKRELTCFTFRTVSVFYVIYYLCGVKRPEQTFTGYRKALWQRVHRLHRLHCFMFTETVLHFPHSFISFI